MYEESKGFKTALMGGFNREDVLQYIEQSAKESSQRLAALQQENELLLAERNELREKNEALSQKNADLLERLGEMTVADEKLQTSAQEHARRAEQGEATLRELQERVAALEKENRTLREQSREVAARCAEYDALKENLTEMELAAHRRAHEIEERAQFDAKRVRVQSAEVITALKKELLTVCDAYRSAAAHAEQVAEENARRTTGMQTMLDGVIQTLDEVVVGELSPEQADGTERPTLQRILDSLKK